MIFLSVEKLKEESKILNPNRQSKILILNLRPDFEGEVATASS